MMGGGVGWLDEKHIRFDDGRGGLCNQVVILEKTKLYLKKKKDT